MGSSASRPSYCCTPLGVCKSWCEAMIQVEFQFLEIQLSGGNIQNSFLHEVVKASQFTTAVYSLWNNLFSCHPKQPSSSSSASGKKLSFFKVLYKTKQISGSCIHQKMYSASQKMNCKYSKCYTMEFKGQARDFNR